MGALLPSTTPAFAAGASESPRAAPTTKYTPGRRGERAEAWAGVSFRDLPDGHVVVSWLLPGPLKGKGLECDGADLARPDLVVAIDGQPPGRAKEAEARIRTMSPGDTLHLDVRTSRKRGGAIPDTLDHEEAVRRIDVVLADRAEWTGTLGTAPATGVDWVAPGVAAAAVPAGGPPSVVREAAAATPSRDGSAPPAPRPATRPATRLLDPADPANVLCAAIDTLGLATKTATLLGVFRKWQADNPDFHSLSHVRAGFEDPFLLPEIARDVTAPAAFAAKDPLGTAANLLRGALDAPRPRRAPLSYTGAGKRGRGKTGAPPPDARAARPPEEAVLRWWVAETRIEDVLRDVGAHLDRALGDAAADTVLARQTLALLRVPHQTFYLEGDATREHIAVIRRSMQVDFAELAAALEAFAPLVAADRTGLTDWSAPPDRAVPPPTALADAVSGDIRSAFHVDDVGWIVVGGDGANRYDLAKIAGVLEPGGDDEYVASDLAFGARAVVDLAGDDKYTGTAEQGPAAALLGAVLVDDRAGDDRYEGAMLSTGAAAFGVAFLLDRAGADAYVGSQWSIGAGLYGAGIVMDLGPGGDAYLGDFLCEGVGGPRGLGAIVDEAGNDLYRANGPTPSAYGTPAVYQSFSQGLGFGFRQYAAGGVGLLCDLAGDDRYESGEFAQGGAYFWALGVLWDANGRDLYYGNRYGQGFGVHQALGALIDDAGDDDYWSMTAASQGSAWDIGCGLLLDVAGNDQYRCDGLGQGAAAQQAIGLHVDLGGDDAREGRGGTAQGAAGGNEYHGAETGAGSLGVLLDLGGGTDRYSEDRRNQATTSPHGVAPAEGLAGKSGIFVDR